MQQEDAARGCSERMQRAMTRMAGSSSFSPTAVKLSSFGSLLSSSSPALPAPSSSCQFLPHRDCTGLVTPPGFIRNFGSDAAAQARCCTLCANHSQCATAVLATDQGGVCMLKPHGTTCSHTDNDVRIQCQPSNKPAPIPPPPPPPPLVPQWKPTYNMSLSTTIMPCNYSGLYDYEKFPSLGRFSLVDFDWSSAKAEWVNQSPMVRNYLS